MGYFESDAQEMLDIYLLESRQLMEQLAAILLSGERAGGYNGEDIRSIFRIMHTIKSSSAMMGLGGLSSLAHKLEDLFGFYREKYGEIKKADQELVDLLLDASDFIDNELEQMPKESYMPGGTAKLESRTDVYLSKIRGQEDPVEQVPEDESSAGEDPVESMPAPAVARAKPPEELCSKPGMLVRIIFETGCRMENIRAFMLARQITGLCDVLETFPVNLDKAQECAGYIEENGVFFRIESEKQEEVLEALKRGLFVDHCEVISIQEAKPVKEEPAPEAPAENKEAEFLNIKTERLDHLQNLVAELLIQMMMLENQLEQAGLDDLKEGAAHQLSRLIGEVDHTVMKMRLVPISRIIPKVRRTLRDICRNEHKEIDLVINCGDIEADKSVVEYVSEALLHLLRNAVDHGIESPEERVKVGKSRKGKITFTVESTIGELMISVQDDGRGLDEEKIRASAEKKGLLEGKGREYDRQEILDLILLPGFTTNDEVTEYSGRGVGLDVVKSILEDAGGHFYIRSEQGKGTTFIMTVPMTLATMECVRFNVGEYRFSVPARHVYRFLEYEDNKQGIRRIDGHTYILFEGRLIPLIDLREFYGLPGEIPEESIAIYVHGAEKEACILADNMYQQKRIVAKPIPALLGIEFRNNTGISGCSIMGSGKICTALDVEILIERYERREGYGNGK